MGTRALVPAAITCVLVGDGRGLGWGSAGDVLLDVPVATLETLYQQYLAEPDFLNKVCSYVC
jgi:hypothetical protein